MGLFLDGSLGRYNVILFYNYLCHFGKQLVNKFEFV